MRMIDAEELMEHVYRDKLDSRELIANMIKNAPTIEERKVGEWIRKISVVDCATFVGDECSQCGYFKSMGQANFCPNCGADMRGGNHE